jgi:hypothetical protein
MPMPPRHGHNQPVRRCQHCERDIELTGNGVWVDREGFGVCIKYTGPLAHGETPPYLYHTPMPVIT